jgi:ABC-type dipeptide/oligopeptide/nickel transport system permease subunit
MGAEPQSSRSSQTPPSSGGANAAPRAIPALLAPPVAPPRFALLRTPTGLAGLGVLVSMVLACLLTLPWTLGDVRPGGAGSGGGGAASVARYNVGETSQNRLPPFWVGPRDADIPKLHGAVEPARVDAIAGELGMTRDQVLASRDGPAFERMREHWPSFWLGTDALGRSVLVRVLAGGGSSLVIGIAAATLSVCIGTLYGSLAGYLGGRVEGVMMRIVDVLYGLPYVLLVVLLAIASDAMVGEYLSRQKERGAWVRAQAVQLVQADAAAQPQPNPPATRSQWRDAARDYLVKHPGDRERLEREALERFKPREVSQTTRTILDMATLLIAIGGVSWLTMARVIRGQVLSLKQQPFIEAARALGLSTPRIFFRHLLPNLVGPIIVYATLTVPQAILQESFLSFLGIGVKPPLPSWGNLAAEGLVELNPYQSNWWLLLFPCLLLATTLLSLNFLGEGLRDALDPKRSRGR